MARVAADYRVAAEPAGDSAVVFQHALGQFVSRFACRGLFSGLPKRLNPAARCGGRRQNQLLAGLAADAFADACLHLGAAADALHAREAVLAGAESGGAGAIVTLIAQRQPEN